MITSAPSLNPQVEQVYPIVNSLFKQMTGLQGIEAVDTNSLVAMGSLINNLGKNDLYLNSLARRIGRTITDYRTYSTLYLDLARSNIEWGAIVQKIHAEMPEATDCKIYEVGFLDGQSVDQWIISNPKASQKLFDKETPYSFFITISTKMLKDAFLSEGAMQHFISIIFLQVQNKISVVMEELGRLCVNNFILNVENRQHLHLVSMYNAEVPGANLTSASCIHDADFLRYTIGIINMMSKKFEDMSVLYNKESRQKFTPKKYQRLYLLSDFMERIKTVVSYAAFHKDDITARPNITIPFFQSNSLINTPNYFEDITTISGSVQGANGTSEEKTLNNVLGVMFDHDAMGTFREEETVLTTPINARAAYYNTFWHERPLWFNDMAENGIVFFLD